MGNLVRNIETVVQERPDDPAIVFKGQETTYAQLWEQTGRFAQALRDQGLQAGDRIAIYLPNLPQWVIAYHGALRAGCVVVPMNPQYKAREIEHLLRDSTSQLVVAWGDLMPFVDEVRDATKVSTVVSVGGDGGGEAIPFGEFMADSPLDVVDRADDDLAVLPYTSGTTGTPKGVELTHANLAGNASQVVEALPEGMQPEDKVFGALPLFHIYGMNAVMNPTLFGGGTFAPLPGFDPKESAQLIEDEQLTIIHGVPAMYNGFIQHPEAESFDLSSLRLGGVGGAGIPLEVLRTFESMFDVKLYEGYGLTETSPVTHFNSPNWGRRIGSIGKTLPGVEARIVDESFEDVEPIEKGPVDEDAVDLEAISGEIVIHGPNVMKGYYNLPKANDKTFTVVDGKRWFHTGDIGYLDEDGFFYVVDRKKHMILSKGYNVYPREIEELLFEHPEVAEAAVVGIPHEDYGEMVKAFVVPTTDSEVTPDDIKAYCLENLAEYKHPREVTFVEELPRTTTGKVQKFELTG